MASVESLVRELSESILNVTVVRHNPAFSGFQGCLFSEIRVFPHNGADYLPNW